MPADIQPTPDLPEVPPTAKLPMQFDPGFGIQSHPEIEQDLKIAQSGLTGLLGKIRDNITQGVAGAASFQDGLLDKIVEPIRQDLGHAAVGLQSLQGKILGDIAGHLGATMEGASKLGIVPPVPGQPDIMPAVVQIRQSAMAGDLTPAFDAYRLTALPYENYGGMQYANAMQAIQNALPNDPATRTAFATGVGALSQQAALSPSPPDGAVSPAFVIDPTTFARLSDVTAFTDVTQCTAERAKALQEALANCAVVYAGNPVMIGECQATVQQQFLHMPPCEGPGGGGGVPGVPSGPPTGGGGVGVGGVIRQGPGGSCPPGYHAGVSWNGTDWFSCIKDVVPPKTTLPPPGAIVPVPLPGVPVGGGVGGGAAGGVPPPNGNPPPPTAYCKDKQGNPQTPGSLMMMVSVAYSISGDVFAAAALVSEQTGIPIVVRSVLETCPDGFSEIGIDTGAQYSPAVKLCIKCPPTDSTPPPTDKCCPPTVVNVTCPPGTTPPPVSPSPGPPKIPPPPAPAPAGPPVVNVPIAGCDEFGPVPGVRDSTGFKDLSKILGLTNWDGTITPYSSEADPSGIVTACVNGLLSFLRHAVDQIGAGADNVAKGAVCMSDDMIALSVVSLVTGLFEKYIGNTLDPIAIPNQQQRNFLCPTLLPSVDGTADAWFGNTIDEKTAECWVRAANGRWPEFRKMFDARRAKLPALQIGSLWLRGKLTDAQFAERIRELGFTHGTEVADFAELLKQIPPPTDLVRFMVRDVEDANIIGAFGLDTDFDQKFAGRVKQWAKESGVSEEYMLRVWRAHWSIPSPGQLMEFLHRSAELDPADPAYVSLGTVEKALEQQDILPFWIPRFINAAFSKLGRIDLRRGFQLGVIDLEDLQKKYEVAGYSPNDSFTLANITLAQTEATFLRSPWVTRFAEGFVTDEEFSKALEIDGASPEMISHARERALTVASAKTRKRCTNAYHKRFLIGDLDRDDAQANLLSLGLPADIVDRILAGWDCERSAAGKAIPAGELSNLYDQGAIDAAGLVKRLRAIGYDYGDAVLLSRRIATTTAQKVTKRESDAIRKQEAEDLRQRKAVDTAVRRATAQQNASARRVLSLQRIRQLRQKRLLESGRNFSTHSGLSLSDAAAAVTGVYDAKMSTGVYLPDEVIAAIATATKAKTTTTVEQLSTVVGDLLADVAVT